MNKLGYLYRPLTLPAAFLIATALIAYVMYEWVEENNQQQLQQHQQLLKQADLLYNQVNQLQQKVGLVNSYYGRFQQAYQAGQLADQSRITWIDQLMLLVKQHDIRRVSLNFTARTPLAANEFSVLTPMHKLFKQEILDFEGEFQHEGDWLAFMQNMKVQVNPNMLIKSCQLSNLSVSESNLATPSELHFHWDRGNILVKCQLLLLVYDLPKNNGGKP